ncbi:MAG: holo-[acyl-carrier-protein] synthase [Ruminococcaceae bacterium]|nr:holo-[acyl-carrier-protein] synthase [Oscillospiraceae bacterium]
MEILCGTDLVEIERFKKILERNDTGFINKCFTLKEQETCNSKAGGKRSAESYAARFAAKEACGKALGTGIMSEGIGLTDIEVETDKKGAPYLVLSGKAKEKAEELGVFSISVSLTHDGGMAAAYCCMLAERKDFNG